MVAGYKKVASPAYDVQRARIVLITILSSLEMFYLSVVFAGYYYTIPFWLVAINCVCVFLNMPLIWKLYSAWRDDLRKEKAKKQ